MKVEELTKDILEDSTSGAAQLTIKAADAFLKLLEGKPTSRSVKKLVKKLAEIRPSMPSIANMAYRISALIDEQVAEGVSLEDAIESAVRSAVKEYRERVKGVIEHASRRLRKYSSILTHSYSSTLITTIELCKKLKIYVTESRPGCEGRWLAEKLAEKGFNVTLIVDSAASYIIDEGEVDAVVTGCDAILDDCSIVNKIGTKMVALAASEAGIPFFVITDLWKAAIHGFSLEEHPPGEVYDGDVKNLSAVNPYFEIVPARLITSFITEEGVLKPSKLGKVLAKLWGYVPRGERKLSKSTI